MVVERIGHAAGVGWEAANALARERGAKILRILPQLEGSQDLMMV